MEEAPFDTKQIALETAIIEHHSVRYLTKARELIEDGRESMLSPVQRLMATAIDPLSKGFADWVKTASTAPARRATAFYYISNMNPDVFALITLKQILNTARSRTRLQAITKRIGSKLEAEIKLEAFEKEKPALYRTISRRVDDDILRDQVDYRVRVLLNAANKYQISHTPWPDDVLLHIGALALDLCIKHTGFVRKYQAKVGKFQGWFVSPDDSLVEHLDKADRAASSLFPVVKPMLCKPLDHAGESTGGPLLPPLREPIIKSAHPLACKLVTPETAPVVYRAINAVQRVPWTIDGEVLKALEDCWRVHGLIPEAARRSDIERPPRPSKSSELGAWKDECKRIFKDNRSNTAKRLAVVMTLSLASEYVDKPMWFTYKLDFRGRMYARESWLNPQGSDMSRGLLKFHRGVPLGARGMYWLQVHVANTFGHDKVSFDDRIEWCKKHADLIKAVAEDPVSCTGWHVADSPVQFLAACKELSRAWKVGETYVSHIPVMFDGTCNGLQHLAAMTRDKQVGDMVNLTPSAAPKSIYEMVAVKCNGVLKTSPENAGWAEYGVDKAGAKRPTMIVPYNGGLFAFMRYLRQWVDKRHEDGKPPPYTGKELSKGLFRLASVMSQAIDEAIPLPRAFMKWTKDMASVIMPEGGSSIRLTLPTGFVMIQHYRSNKERVVKTRIGDKIMKLGLQYRGDGVDKLKQRRSLAPNITHAYDAAHMQLTACDVLDHGIEDMCFNHDSYGAHAANGDTLRQCNNRQFVLIYENDVKGAIYEELKSQAHDPTVTFPQPPPHGELCVRDVIQSLYFFG
jgi:DNA-directed RNA polymerase